MERPPVSVLRQSEKALGRPPCRGPHTCRCRCSTMPPSAPWSPTADAFAQHQFSHVQGWLKSTRNSYLNTGNFPRNHIWMSGVLKKSIFAYLKFHICIPKNSTSAYYCIFWSFDCSVHVTSIPLAHLLNVWLYHHFTSRICRMDAPQQDYDYSTSVIQTCF